MSSALAIQQRGFKVLVVDPVDEFRRASFGNAGVVSCGSILPMAGPSVHDKLWAYAFGRETGLRIRPLSMPRITPWIRSFLAHSNTTSRDRCAALLQPLTRASWDAHLRLATQVDAHDLLTYRGWIRLYRSASAWDSAAPERLLLRRHGVALSDLDQTQLRALEPALAPFFSHGSMVDDAGAINSPEVLLRRMQSVFVERGGVITRGKAKQITFAPEKVVIATVDMQLHAEKIVLAAGAWSSQLLKRMGLRFPFAAERGYHQHFRLQSQVPDLQRPVYDTSSGVVLSPMGGDKRDIRVLSGVELGLPDSSPNYGMLQRAIIVAKQILPLANEPSSEAWLGSRPSTPDGLPIIGHAPNDPRLLLAFGHGHIGLSTGPLTGELIASLAVNESPAFDLAPFSINRFLR